MAKLSKQEIEEIVQRDMPGYKVVHHEEGTDERAVEASPDEVAPDIDTLREKYLGDSENTAAEGNNPDGEGSEPAPVETENHTDSDEENTDDAIVAVQPEQTSDPFDHAARPKTIVVSGKDRRVIGSQG
jgi:hypothetical protein